MIDNNNNIGISVVIDDHPRFYCELVLWLLCAKEVLSMPIRVYFVNKRPKGLIDFVANSGADIRFVETLLPESPHCNKLIPFLDPEGFKNQIVSDADLFFIKDIAVFFDFNKVRLPPNNHGLPPLNIFQSLFEAAGFKKMAEPGTSLFTAQGLRETFIGNVSAGLIFVPATQLSFIQQWHERARWLVTQREILGKFSFHIDQISCAMAIEEFDIPFKHLPPQTNTVLQLLPEVRTIFGFHLSHAHVPKFKEFFNLDKTLNADAIRPGHRDQINLLNNKILEAVDIMNQLSETKNFVDNFLNPRNEQQLSQAK